MPFNVADFRSRGLKLGGARPNQFEVTIHAAFSNQKSAMEQITFVARAASIPPAIVEEIPVFYFGRAIKYAGDRVFPPWDLTIMNDEDYAVRNFFETWSNHMNALISNRMDPAVHATKYKAQGFVKQFGKTGDTIREYELDGVWPSVVDAMPLDWAAQNQIQEFNVTLAYDFWRPAGGSTGNAPYSPTLAPDSDGDSSVPLPRPRPSTF